MANHNNKDVKYVGDSRVPDRRVPNIPKDYSEFPGKTEAFWPNFLLREWMVGAVVLVAFLVLTVAHEPPLEIMADPTDTGYYPVPDWYFLFLFQLLKYSYLSGPYTVLGTVVVPGLAFGALMLAPWLDRGPERRPTRRPVATGLMLLAIFSIFYLTYAAAEDHDWSQNEQYAAKNQPEVEIDTQSDGYQVYASQSCIDCHGEQLDGLGVSGPAIYNAGEDYTVEEIQDIALNGIGTMPAGMFEGSDEELELLAEWLASLAEEE
ncbi:menaquinol-cytochrome c reductase cytochrome b/c subunit [Caldalkalibacillus salinus]|uniref:menaquinol-cytochrome c reductase cytochrome b/c subunit n=1 Tax=Caldalkalibacillus salinus TaxID=2803787 RepID=UPI0019209CDF|nr:menaquinol-cytochrome c reductase cytochrome b/c subunit [Caldalkalibacillus salinus]